MLVRVTNKQQYPVVRGGYTFPALGTIEVEVKSDRQLTEIKACVYLKVAPVEVVPAAGDPEPMTKAELLAAAEAAGIDAKKGWTNARLIEALQAAAEGGDEPADDEADDAEDEAGE